MKTIIDIYIDLNEPTLLDNPSQIAMELGITYKRHEASPIADLVVLRDCSNVPEKLPAGFRVKRVEAK